MADKDDEEEEHVAMEKEAAKTLPMSILCSKPRVHKTAYQAEKFHMLREHSKEVKNK